MNVPLGEAILQIFFNSGSLSWETGRKRRITFDEPCGNETDG